MELQFIDAHFGLSVEEAKKLMIQAMETSFAEKRKKRECDKGGLAVEGRVCLSVLDRFRTEVEDWLGIKRIGGD